MAVDAKGERAELNKQAGEGPGPPPRVRFMPLPFLLPNALKPTPSLIPSGPPNHLPVPES